MHENKLENIGIRSPLYLKALEKANIDIEQIPDISSVDKLPDNSIISEKLKEWEQKNTLNINSIEPKPLLELKDV